MESYFLSHRYRSYMVLGFAVRLSAAFWSRRGRHEAMQQPDFNVPSSLMLVCCVWALRMKNVVCSIVSAPWQSLCSTPYSHKISNILEVSGRSSHRWPCEPAEALGAAVRCSADQRRHKRGELLYLHISALLLFPSLTYQLSLALWGGSSRVCLVKERQRFYLFK